ncbi:unnamed protein product [Allacma fusca]|uniref:Uncharacterized protein n=1 Tax=Allacma fusca TaxID=39272 RepID=A0A8J2K6U6_9HEXA|nr:unnamed protein product [Allacma fusca]
MVAVTEEAKLNLRKDYWAAKFPSQMPLNNLTGNDIYGSTQTLPHQPPVQYRIKFIKFVIKKLETSDDCSEELTEKWYETLEELSGAPVQQEPFYRLYAIAEMETPIKIYEDEKAFVSEGSTGFITWRASLELAKWISIDQLATMNGNCCWAFELGCGTGLLALAIMTKFPHLSKFFATDVHQGVLARCGQNISANQLSHKIDTSTLDWVQDEEKFSNMCQHAVDNFRQPGILLGADVIFDISVIPFLRRIIENFFSFEPLGRAYFSCAIRNQDTFDEFQRHIKESRLHIEILHNWGNEESNGVIFEVQKYLST